MADVHSGIIRSKNMRAIASDNTVIEQKVAGLLDQMAVGYRVQAAELPGKPDFVLDAYNAVIFVHGCFWHQHNCHFFKLPATRTDFWRDKINKNSERDLRNRQKISISGWRVLIVWECALRGRQKLAECCCQQRIEEWLCASACNAEINTQGIHQLPEQA